jgi:hypothetical protein
MRRTPSWAVERTAQQGPCDARMCRDEHRQLEAQLDAKRSQLNQMCGTRTHALARMHTHAPTHTRARAQQQTRAAEAPAVPCWMSHGVRHSRVSCTTARGGTLDRRFGKLMRANQAAATLYNELQNTQSQFRNRVQGPLIMEVRSRHRATDTVQHATSNGQHAADSMQQTTCSRQRAADTVQRTPCNMQRGTDTVQRRACSRQRAADNVQQTPCNGHRAADSVQQTTCSRQRAAAADRMQQRTCSRRHAADDMRQTTQQT